ncbi:cell adhesion molecule 3-like isoform X1 [Stegastes partitus]|uniref:Cell adhesion molecule 3-like isoform X1 n=1 Tax=Stegastes partitus TaxID=144197 RepID=A0A9Y4NBC3_9TELE|nr:PREDICTED: cell adhesion molecule 3-like isoform X1 [Stegastes partitus]
MEAVVGLLVMLLGVSHGLETHCDARVNGTQCYGALGGTVVLQLMDTASEIPRYQWRKDASRILIGRKNDVLVNSISSRSDFTPSNGTFRISNLSRTDSGEYTLEIFNSNGEKTAERTLHLSVQAPVSSVRLVSECLSQGQMRMSCSSVGGDSPQYSWTLGGRELTDDELLSGNTEAENITLNANISGYLACSVRNHVSSVCGLIFSNCTSSNGTQTSKMELVSNDIVCIAPTPSTTSTVGKDTGIESIKPSTNITSSKDEPCYDQSLLVCGLQAGVFILSVAAISIFFTCKRKKCKKAEALAVAQTTEYPENSVVMVEM